MKGRAPTPLFEPACIAPLRAPHPYPSPKPVERRASIDALMREGDSGARDCRPRLAGDRAELDAYGSAIAPKLIARETCRELAALYGDDARFRSRIVMAAHGFGRGEYKYFADPLPELIVALRRGFYSRLAPIADRWNEAMGVSVRYPAEHEAFLERCHAAGQTRPTPLLLRYGPGDYNCLHQDVYGEHLFPLQVAILLSEPGHDFTGGEFVLTEQRPRMQSRAEVAPLRQGDGVIFAVRERPVQGTRGTYRVNLRHGVSRIRSGERFTLRSDFSRREVTRALRSGSKKRVERRPSPEEPKGSSGAANVGQGEIVSLEQEGFARRSAKRVGETVAKVQARLVPAFAEVEKSLPSQLALLDGDGLDDEARAAEEGVGLARAVRTELALDHHREFDMVRHADPADVGRADAFNEVSRLRLPVEDGDEGGRVDDHLGRPCSSYRSSAWSR